MAAEPLPTFTFKTHPSKTTEEERLALADRILDQWSAAIDEGRPLGMAEK
jgi:hypothetical protein